LVKMSPGNLLEIRPADLLDTVLHTHTHTHTRVLRPFFRDHPGEPVPEENLWTLWCKGKINRGRHSEHLAGCHSIRIKQYPPPPSRNFFTGRMPFLPPSQ